MAHSALNEQRAAYISATFAAQPPQPRDTGGAPQGRRLACYIAGNAPEIFPVLKMLMTQMEYSHGLSRFGAELTNLGSTKTWFITIPAEHADKLETAMHSAATHFNRPHLRQRAICLAAADDMHDLLDQMTGADIQDMATLVNGKAYPAQGFFLTPDKTSPGVPKQYVVFGLNRMLSELEETGIPAFHMRPVGDGMFTVSYPGANVPKLQHYLRTHKTELYAKITEFCLGEALAVDGLRPGTKDASLLLLNALCEAQTSYGAMRLENGQTISGPMLTLQTGKIQPSQLSSASGRLARVLGQQPDGSSMLAASGVTQADLPPGLHKMLVENMDGSVRVCFPEAQMDAKGLVEWFNAHKQQLQLQLQADYRASDKGLPGFHR